MDFTVGEVPYAAGDAAAISAYIQAHKAKEAKKAAKKKTVIAKKRSRKRAA